MIADRLQLINRCLLANCSYGLSDGQTVIVDSEKLSKALLCLSEGWREIILMRYFLQLRDKQMGALLGKPRTTVNYQKNAALKQLRTEMEKMNDEE